VVEYLAFNLLTNSNNAEVAGFLDKYDFIFFPVVNPDGKPILLIHLFFLRLGIRRH
jgi:murein tripeptide amidase MpaA